MGTNIYFENNKKNTVSILISMISNFQSGNVLQLFPLFSAFFEHFYLLQTINFKFFVSNEIVKIINILKLYARSLGAQGDSSGAEGVLVRKHDWESTTKKAANRSWDKVSSRLKPQATSIITAPAKISNRNLIKLFKHFFSRFQVYVVARGSRLTFFKDQKASKAQPEQTFKGELPLILDGASVDVANDYKKRKHVFRIK